MWAEAERLADHRRLREAVSDYLAALDRQRAPSIPTARNSPDPDRVRAARRQRLKEAEKHLRQTYEDVT